MKIIGIFLLLGGTMGILHSWMRSLREGEEAIEEFLLFFQKSIGVMEKEKIKVIDYFTEYPSPVLRPLLLEIAKRLAANIYPSGQMVWEEVFMEAKQKLSFDQETFHIILKAGNGFFGRSKEENIRFLKRTANELEIQHKRRMEKNAKERKVWVPVGMLSALMFAILFV